MMSSKASIKLNVMVGLNSSIVFLIGVRSSCTPITLISWPSTFSVRTTSYSMRHSAVSAVTLSTCSSGGSRPLCTSARTRCGFTVPPSQRDPVSAAVQEVHHLHGEQHGEFLQRILFGPGEAQFQFAATDDDVLQHFVDRVLVDAGPVGDHLAQLAAVAANELRRGHAGRILGRLGEQLAEVAIVEGGMIEAVVAALLLVVVPQCAI